MIVESSRTFVESANIGTLVSDQFVVTAASVFDDEDDPSVSTYNADLFEAKPGAKDWEETSNNFVRWRPIEEIWIHPYFKKEMMEGRGLGYNVGLLKLKRKIVYLHEFGSTRFGVRPICLPTPNETPDKTKHENLVGKHAINARALEDLNIVSTVGSVGLSLGVVTSTQVMDFGACRRKLPQMTR